MHRDFFGMEEISIVKIYVPLVLNINTGRSIQKLSHFCKLLESIRSAGDILRKFH